MRRLFLATLIAVSAFAEAEPTLAPYEAEYKVKFSVFSGRLTTRLEEHDAGFQATHALETTGMSRMLARGSITEQSWFSSNSEGLIPSRFVTSDELTKDNTSANLEFDWAGADASIVGDVNGAPFSMPIEPHTHDRVSIQYQLMEDMRAGATAKQYQMFDIDEIKYLGIENIGTKVIKTAAGDFEAVGIRHQSEGSSRSTTFWLAKELGFAPALIEQHRKGKQRLKATLVRYDALAPAAETLTAK